MLDDVEKVLDIDLYSIKLFDYTTILIKLDTIEYNEEEPKQSKVKVLKVY